jgi:hypothetical protein
MKRLLCTLPLVVPGLTSCSSLLNLAVQNNTGGEVEICNLLRHENSCVSAKSHAEARILMVADEPGKAWRFRVSAGEASNTYTFGNLWSLRSLPCNSGCEVVVQLEPDGLIYWVDASRNRAVPAPAQPDGFPVRPGA